MKKIICMVFALIFAAAALAGCDGGDLVSLSETTGPPEETEVPETPAPTPAATMPTPVPTPAPTPTPSPTPVPEPTNETPDSAGTGSVTFDIYVRKAARDLNGDGTPEQIEFSQGPDSSALSINGVIYEINKPGLAQLFAVTDVDNGDSICELLFTEEYDPDLADGEFPFSWLYWWNGTDLFPMGGLLDVKFDGAWRSDFVAADHFDSEGIVMCLTQTTDLTDIWYIGKYRPDGTNRELLEAYYPAEPIFPVGGLTCKKPCLLLEERGTDYFNSAYDYYWIPTLEPTTLGRIHEVDEGIEIIAQTGEVLNVAAVYGKRWFKLRTWDGYEGWIRCVDKKVIPYDFTMGWTAYDIFSGIVDAG